MNVDGSGEPHSVATNETVLLVTSTPELRNPFMRWVREYDEWSGRDVRLRLLGWGL